MEFDKNEITGVNIEQEGISYEFSKRLITITPPPEAEKTETEEESESPEPTEEEAWVLPDGGHAEKSKLDSIISDLANLRCDEFLEGQNLEDLEDPIYSVTAKGAKDYTLQIFAKQEEEGGKYPAFSSENPYPFLLPTYRAEQIMKKPDELIKKEEGETENKKN
jgi:hypothetical protein